MRGLLWATPTSVRAQERPDDRALATDVPHARLGWLAPAMVRRFLQERSPAPRRATGPQDADVLPQSGSAVAIDNALSERGTARRTATSCVRRDASRGTSLARATAVQAALSAGGTTVPACCAGLRDEARPIVTRPLTRVLVVDPELPEDDAVVDGARRAGLRRTPGARRRQRGGPVAAVASACGPARARAARRVRARLVAPLPWRAGPRPGAGRHAACHRGAGGRNPGRGCVHAAGEACRRGRR